MGHTLQTDRSIRIIEGMIFGMAGNQIAHDGVVTNRDAAGGTVEAIGPKADIIPDPNTNAECLKIPGAFEARVPPDGHVTSEVNTIGGQGVHVAARAKCDTRTKSQLSLCL